MGAVEMQKILIVDDSATSRMIIKRCFQIAGLREVEYLEAEDALKAISLLHDGDVDLILSDLKMPKMDGHTFIRKLRVFEPTKEIPVIVISSMGGDVSETDLTASGVSAIIKKPVSPEKVIEALGRMDENPLSN
jgi:two-component system, chemotaxis family, chemotaxis protein CheY